MSHGRVRPRSLPPRVLLAPAALAFGVAAACATGAPATDGGPTPAAVDTPVSPVPPRVYVTDQDDATVTVLDAESGEIVETVELEALGFPATARPHHVVVEPNGAFWYVSLIGANRVLKLDARNRVVGEAGFEAPGLLALELHGDRLLVGRSMSAVSPPQRVGVIDRRDMSVEEIDVPYARPHALAVHPTRGLAYSASLAVNRMAVIDLGWGTARVLDLPPPLRPAGARAGAGGFDERVHALVQWAVSPDGRTLVGTGEMSAELLVFDLADPAAPRPVTQIPVAPRPWHPSFSPDGRWVWFANKGADAVTVVDARSWTVAGVVTGDGLAEPHGLAFSPDGRLVFVSCNNLQGRYPGGAGTVVVIDAASRRVRAVRVVGRDPTGVGTPVRP